MTPSPTTLLSLAARAEAGGDDYLSDDCWSALGWEFGGGESWKSPDGVWFDEHRPDLQASLDAQEALPAKVVSMAVTPAGSTAWAADGYSEIIRGRGRAPSEKLARLAALLRALAAQEEPSGE